MRGGYQILDLANKPLTSGTKTATDGKPYEAVDGSNGKRVVVSGLTIDGDTDTKYNDFECYFSKNDTKYQGSAVVGGESVAFDIEDKYITVTTTTIS